MKISLGFNCNKESTTGRLILINKVFDYLKERQKIKIVDASSNPDIHFNTISGSRHKKAKTILRVDGIYFDKPRLKSNKPIFDSIKNSDGIVFQSHFSFEMISKQISLSSKKFEIIHNGSNIKKEKNKIFNYDHVFFCCSHWRPNKRLSLIIDSFLEAKKQIEGSCCLLIAGDGYSKKIDEDCLKYLGLLKNKELDRYYKSSDYFIHACYIDACPNVVVDAICYGLPVVCTNNGGTKEIVKDSGIVANVDSPYDFRIFSSDSDISNLAVDKNAFVEAIKEVTKKEWKIDRKDLSIESISEQYYSFFESFL